MSGALTVCLHRGSSLVGLAIRWFTRGDYSHVSLILPDGRHVEAREGKGVVIHPKFSPNKGETVEFFGLRDPLSEVELNQLLSFVRDTAGEPYDWTMVGAFVWRGKPTKRSETAWFCSEWAYEGLQRAGRQLLRTSEAWRISPEQFGLSPLLVELPRINFEVGELTQWKSQPA